MRPVKIPDVYRIYGEVVACPVRVVRDGGVRPVEYKAGQTKLREEIFSTITRSSCCCVLCLHSSTLRDPNNDQVKRDALARSYEFK